MTDNGELMVTVDWVTFKDSYAEFEATGTMCRFGFEVPWKAWRAPEVHTWTIQTAPSGGPPLDEQAYDIAIVDKPTAHAQIAQELGRYWRTV